MEEMELAMNQPDHEEIKKTESPRWYEGHISLEDAKTFIKANIATAARSFIAIGFYLKCVRDRELFLEEEYPDVWEFAKSEYGISKSTASRYMSMNDRFSENGNSPNVREEYRSYGKSQLQEMLYLEEEQLEQVKPGDRVEDIRNLRRLKEVPYIELPGQMEIEIDFPQYMPDPPAFPMISQKQTFEMSVEDMLSGEGQDVIAISQQDQEPEPEEVQELEEEAEEGPDRTGYVKEQFRLCTIVINSLAMQLIKIYKPWFEADTEKRVMSTDKAEIQLKKLMGVREAGFISKTVQTDEEVYYIKLYRDAIAIRHYEDGFVEDGTTQWPQLIEAIQEQWHKVLAEEVKEKRRQAEQQEMNHGSTTLNSTPTNCSHREGYSCTVLVENRLIPGDGSRCGSSCCWECKFQGMCKHECYASAGRNGEIPEFDAAWFVREWAKRSPGDLKRVLEAP